MKPGRRGGRAKKGMGTAAAVKAPDDSAGRSPAESSLEKERKTLKVLEGIIREKEELLKHHEDKVIHLKQEYEKRLHAVEGRENELEARAAEIKQAERSSGELLEQHRKLKARCERLAREELFLKAAVAALRKDIAQLHGEEARKRVELAVAHKKHAELQNGFDAAFHKADRLNSYLKSKKDELGRLGRALEEASERHSRLTSQITHHSISEVRLCIRRANEHIAAGNPEKAMREYEQIRRFYTHLPRDEKRKVFMTIARIRERLSGHPLAHTGGNN